MVFTEYTKQRILYYHSQGLRPREIVGALEGEGTAVSKSQVWRFLKRYEETGNTKRRHGSGRTSIILLSSGKS
jgi:transposase